MNFRFGLGLLDVSPSLDASRFCVSRCGLTLNKPRRRKPRNEAKVVERSSVYGDLMPSTTAKDGIDQGAIAHDWLKLMHTSASFTANAPQYPMFFG
jgi:hypothetical protein